MTAVLPTSAAVLLPTSAAVLLPTSAAVLLTALLMMTAGSVRVVHGSPSEQDLPFSWSDCSELV